MTRAIGRLTALKVEKAKEPGMYPDGAGLYLRVTPDGHEKLGAPFHARSSAALDGTRAARALRASGSPREGAGRAPQAASRALILSRHDVLSAARQRLDAAKAITFKQCAEAYINSHRAGWRNDKHAGQWGATLSTYAYPAIGALSVQAIDTGLVLKVLEPIWATKPETASRLRGRLENILDFAKVRGYRSGENPARWRGHLAKLLPARSKVSQVEHHSALPYAEVPGFMVALRDQEGVAARALEFTILTAARTGESIGATWDEVSFADKVWIIPGKRMKGGKEHRVPLCDRALAILREIKPADDAPNAVKQFVFSGGKPGTAAEQHGLLDAVAADGAAVISRCTASVPASAIGRPSERTSRAKLPKWRSLTWSATRSRPPIAAATCSRSDAGSCSNGRRSAPPRRRRTQRTRSFPARFLIVSPRGG